MAGPVKSDGEIKQAVSELLGGGRYKRIVRFRDWLSGSLRRSPSEPQMVRVEDVMAELGLPSYALRAHPIVDWLKKGLVVREPAGFTVPHAYRLKLMMLLRRHLHLTTAELQGIFGTYQRKTTKVTGSLYDVATAGPTLQLLIDRLDKEIRLALRLRHMLLSMEPAADRRPAVPLGPPDDWRSVAFMVTAGREREVLRATRREGDQRIEAGRRADTTRR